MTQITNAHFASAPDWSKQTEEIHCPLCDYNLRGLTEPRCPECGYAFEWADLTDPARKKHPYLFEHHPNRNLWSFTRTVIGQLLPRRFWRSVRPEMPSNGRRLMIYWVIICGAWVLWLGMSILVDEVHSVLRVYDRRQQTMKDISRPNAAQFRASMIRSFGSIEAYLDQTHSPLPTSPMYWKRIPNWLWWSIRTLPHSWRFSVPIVFLLLPWMTLLVMNIFRVSMRQARVLPIHVLRVLAYSSDVAVLTLLLSTGLGLAGIAHDMVNPVYRDSPYVRAEAAATGLLVLTFSYRLVAGYQLYLQFKHAAATVIATQVIAFLVLLCIVAGVDPVMELVTVQWMDFERYLWW